MKDGKFTTDKLLHGYFPTYLRIAAELGTAARVCEVGVWGGASLEMWQALFPSGLVCGVDSDPGARWPPGTVKVVRGQDAADLPGILAGYAPWDLIVDDASHDGKLTRVTLDLLWPLLRPGGFYVIEDWMIGLPDSWPQYGAGMLEMAQGLLPLLDRGADVEDITFRYGLAVLRKREPGN